MLLRKITCCLIFFLLLAGSSSAATIAWDGDAGVDNLWNTSFNWDGDVVPNAADTALNNLAGSTMRLVGAASADIVRFGWNAASDLEVDGGSLSVGRHLQIGLTANGNMNMLGGTVDIGQFFTISENPGAGGSAHLQLDGGDITTRNLVVKTAGSIDITGGSLTYSSLVFSVFPTIEEMISNDLITAYGSSGNVIVTSNADSTTTLTAVIPEPTSMVLLGLGLVGSFLLRRSTIVS